jgi:[ribosomal protein S5]-alanine N-acetyltransferase
MISHTNHAPVVFETDRLLLRQITTEDMESILSYTSDPETMVHYPRVWTREIVERLIARVMTTYETRGFGLYVVVLHGTGEVIGDCGFLLQEVNDRQETELGYHIARQHWNRGYATEAARGCRDYAFRQLGLKRLMSLIRPVNLQSRRVAEKTGLTIEQEVVKWGLPHFIYSINDESYAAIRISLPSTFTSKV